MSPMFSGSRLFSEMSVCPLCPQEAVRTVRCPYVPYVPGEAVRTMRCPYVPYVPEICSFSEMFGDIGDIGKYEHLTVRTTSRGHRGHPDISLY